MLQLPPPDAETRARWQMEANARHTAAYLHLQSVMADGTFHHATYRDEGTVWEGLYYYTRDPRGMRGFTLSGCIAKGSQWADEAHELIRHTGYGVGAYGCG